MLARKAIRALLLSSQNKLLLMHFNANWDLTKPDGKKIKKFWCCIGGKIEDGESIDDALVRELYEETGLTKKEIKIGPAVMVGKSELFINGTLTELDEIYILVKTDKDAVSLCESTEAEKQIVTELRWFSLDEIKEIEKNEVIIPAGLSKYIENILAEKYPTKPYTIILV